MFKKFAIPVLAAAIALSGSAFAQASEDLKAAVRPFYEKLLSAPNAKNMPAQAEKVVVEKWVSIPTPRGSYPQMSVMRDFRRRFGFHL